MNESEPRVGDMPRLFDVFDFPKVKSVRATTTIHSKVDIGDVVKTIPKTKLMETSKKKVAKFEVRRGSYLLLFPTGYVEVYAPDESGMREVLLAFRDELYKGGLL